MAKTPGADHTSLHTDAEVTALEQLFQPPPDATPAEKLQFFSLQTCIRAQKRPTTTAIKAAEVAPRILAGMKKLPLSTNNASPAKPSPLAMKARQGMKSGAAG